MKLKYISIILVIATVGFFGWAEVFAAPNNPPKPKKYFVCKYVGKPGEDERLQTGNNPISVSENALTPPVVVGAYFNDAQGRSYVVAEDTGQAEPECPEPDVPDTPPVDDNPTPPTVDETLTESVQSTEAEVQTESAPALK